MAGIAGLALVILARKRSKKTKEPAPKHLGSFAAAGSGPASSSVPQGQSKDGEEVVFQWAGAEDGIAYTPVLTKNDLPFVVMVLLPEKGDFLTLIPEDLRPAIKSEYIAQTPLNPRAIKLTQVLALQPGAGALVSVREIGGPMHTFAFEP